MGFMTDTKKDDAVLSIDPFPGIEEKSAPATEFTLETLPAFPGQGSAVSARQTPTDLERPRSGPSYWNGNGVAHPEVEGYTHDAPVPVPVPKRQGLPSFAQSEFYTVDTIFVHPPAGPGSLICCLFLFFFFFSVFLYRSFAVNVVSGAATASR